MRVQAPSGPLTDPRMALKVFGGVELSMVGL